MPSRLLAVLLLFTVLPTVELAEQLEHAVAHLIDSEAPDHPAHHDEGAGDEHGCTGLVHLCTCHQAQVIAARDMSIQRTTVSIRSTPVAPPHGLVDLTSLEPPHRPPIA